MSLKIWFVTWRQFLGHISGKENKYPNGLTELRILGRTTWAEFVGIILEMKELHREKEIQKFLRKFLSSVWPNTDLCRGGARLEKHHQKDVG